MESIGTMAGGLNGMAAREQNKPFMKVSERKAKKVINKLLSEGKNINYARLGLRGDWNENSTTVYDDGKFFKYNSYHGSNWATPTLVVHFSDNTEQRFDCFTFERK